MIRSHDTLAPFLAPHDPGRGYTFYASMLLAKYAACVAAGTVLYVGEEEGEEEEKCTEKEETDTSNECNMRQYRQRPN